ncbi:MULTISPECIES: EF-hand domain-containing protein [unclassified Sphingomonas]|uniref:EF-hand domain-containing protein n=1 Tax=unclassified Sphingomonas TaxID=196159 RepID=UPI0026CDD96A
MRLVAATICIVAMMPLTPVAAQRAPDAAVQPRVPPITQPPSATIMAEPVALFLGATDADGDARVTRAEAQAGVARSFATVETTTPGSIGYIGLSEWAERWLGDRNALPSAYETDTDADNRITLAELSAQIDRTFTRLDRNKDGVLVRSELLTLDSARGQFGRGLNGRERRGRPVP